MRHRDAGDRPRPSGYRVHGTDLSERSIDRARAEAERLGADVSFGLADFRDLGSVPGEFDVVLSGDNALPHLLDDADLTTALRAMGAKLRPNGLLAVTVRDYDTALVDRPATAPPLLVEGPPRRLVVRLHDWDGPDSRLYTVRFFIITETGAGWTLAHHGARYRAITAAELTRAVEDAGFVDVAWLTGEQAGLHQPVMTASRG